MAFNTPTHTSETTGNKELKLEKKILEKEIGNLGVQHERTAKDVKDIEAAKRKLVDQRVEISKINKKIADKQKKLSDLEKENIIQDQFIETRKKTHSKRMRVLELEYSTRKENLEEGLLKSEKRILLLDQTFEKLSLDIKDKEEEINELKKDIVGLDKRSQLLDYRVDALRAINDEIEEKKKAFEPLRKKVADLENEVEAEDQRLVKVLEESATIKIDLEIAKSKFDKFQKEHSGIMEKFNQDMKERTIALDKKDGLVSEKEQWIKEKETSLRKAKAELEKFYNRKINHVII